jgi:hypothetical protein
VFEIVTWVFGPERFLVAAGNSVPLVEAVVSGKTSVLRTYMPLAHAAGGVTGLGENVSKRPLPRDQSAFLATNGNRVCARTNGVTPGHQRGSGWRALGFGDEVPARPGMPLPPTPAGAVNNEIVHIVDMYTTLARVGRSSNHAQPRLFNSVTACHAQRAQGWRA